MVVNMEVTDTSRVADARYPTADTTKTGDVDTRIDDDLPPKNGASRVDDATDLADPGVTGARTANNELSVGVSDNGNAGRNGCEVDAEPSCSLQWGATSEDRKTESSVGTTENIASSRPASHSPLAFTIDFGDNKEIDKAKYQSLFERYNARHRRNLSTSKVFKVPFFSRV